MAVVLVACFTTAEANTFTVTNNADSGAGSLRQAIMDSNANPPPANTTNLIQFNIAGAVLHTITLASALPDITDAVTIDGFTQPGSSANTHPITQGDNSVHLIEIDGTNSGGANGEAAITLNTGADGSVIRGLVVNRAPSTGIQIFNASNIIVEGCFLGTDPTGTTSHANEFGLLIDDGSSNVTVGGTTPAARNVLSGNLLAGVSIGGTFAAGGTGHIIQGNFIGTDVAGKAALTQSQVGVDFASGSNCTVGGTTAAARNIISGNAGRAIIISHSLGNAAVTGNVVQGNFIGTDLTGTKALGNTSEAIGVYGLANTIGGTVAGAGNIIAASIEAGVHVGGGDGSIIQGNFIGTDPTGTINLGNAQSGIELEANNVTIGGTSAGAGNVIAFNGNNFLAGILINTGTGNAILGNSIFSNNSLGIDLGGDGVTLNDAGDTDSGANNLQNFPVLTSISNSGGMTTINGRLNSAANTMYRIEFFANDAIDSSGYGEGQTYLGFVNTNKTDGSGDVTFSQSFTQIGANQRVTATATDPNGNTSEFSGSIGQLLNISTRMEVQTGNSVLIGGFIVGGSGSMQILLRALGPTLQNFGVAGFLADPTLELHDGSGNLLKFNDNWKDTDEAAIMATGLAPPNDLESAILDTLTPGNYTGIVRGKNNATGVGLIEAYDISKLVGITLTNISTRGFVDINQNVMIGGFISGNGIVRVIIRALGPTLTQFGVPNVLADPTLELHDANGTTIASNDNWKDTQQAEIQASGLAPPNDLESAIIAVRPAANSTAIVQGKNGTTGNALVEVYILPP